MPGTTRVGPLGVTDVAFGFVPDPGTSAVPFGCASRIAKGRRGRARPEYDRCSRGPCAAFAPGNLWGQAHRRLGGRGEKWGQGRNGEKWGHSEYRRRVAVPKPTGSAPVCPGAGLCRFGRSGTVEMGCSQVPLAPPVPGRSRTTEQRRSQGYPGTEARPCPALRRGGGQGEGTRCRIVFPGVLGRIACPGYADGGWCPEDPIPDSSAGR